MGRHRRVAQLARLDTPGLQVADLGAGQGRTVRALLRHDPGVVHALDHVSDLDDDLLVNPMVRSVIADLGEPLPFPDESLDRVTSVNVVEHLPDPLAHLAEVSRVLRPGGVFVLAQSDWDTALFTSPDDTTTRALVNLFAAGPSDGFTGRKLLALAVRARAAGIPLEQETLDTWADPHRRFDDGSVAWKVATSILAAAAADPVLAAHASGWVEGLRRQADAGQFVFTVTDVALALVKPTRRPRRDGSAESVDLR